MRHTFCSWDVKAYYTRALVGRVGNAADVTIVNRDGQMFADHV